MMGRAAPLPRAWRIYAVSNFISQIGTWMQSTAQAWLVLELTGSSELLGLLVAIQYFPAVLLAIPAGKVADRWGRRNLLLSGQATMAILAGGLAAIVAAGNATYPVLAGFALLLGVGNALSQPARIAMAATLAGGEGAGAHGRVRAAGMATLSFNLARILGPVLAGFAIAGYGPTFAFAVNAVSFLPLLLFLAGMDADDRVSSSQRGTGRAAFGLLWTNVSTRIPLLTVAVAGVFAINVQTLVPAYARLGLGLDAGGFGLLMGAFGAGACVGGFLQWRRPAVSIWRSLAAAAGLGLCLAALSGDSSFSAGLPYPGGIWCLLGNRAFLGFGCGSAFRPRSFAQCRHRLAGDDCARNQSFGKRSDRVDDRTFWPEWRQCRARRRYTRCRRGSGVYPSSSRCRCAAFGQTRIRAGASAGSIDCRGGSGPHVSRE